MEARRSLPERDSRHRRAQVVNHQRRCPLNEKHVQQESGFLSNLSYSRRSRENFRAASLLQCEDNHVRYLHLIPQSVQFRPNLRADMCVPNAAAVP